MADDDDINIFSGNTLFFSPQVTFLQYENPLVVHISHPHGQPKMVSFGSMTICLTGDGHYHQLYTAPTCPGGSGGSTWVIPDAYDSDLIYGVPHSGHHGNMLNEGSSWTIYSPLDSDNQ
jgi:hypothetical protein